MMHKHNNRNERRLKNTNIKNNKAETLGEWRYEGNPAPQNIF